MAALLRSFLAASAVASTISLSGCAAPGATVANANPPGAITSPYAASQQAQQAAQAQRDIQAQRDYERQRQEYIANQQYQRDLQARQAREQQQNGQAQTKSSNPVDQIADKIRAEQEKAENAGMPSPTN